MLAFSDGPDFVFAKIFFNLQYERNVLTFCNERLLCLFVKIATSFFFRYTMQKYLHDGFYQPSSAHQQVGLSICSYKNWWQAVVI
jgi:hypothetical protein